MPNGSPINIDVTLSGSKVQAPNKTATRGSAPPIFWNPAPGLTIMFIGFNDPVGNGKEISQPTKQASGSWMANDQNKTAKMWTYSIFAADSKGVVYSSDPQIINEGEGGDDMEMEEEDEGPGRGRGSGG